TGEELVALESPIGEGFANAQSGHPRRCASGPVILRHVAEAEARIHRAGGRVRAARGQVDPREESVYQDGRLVTGDGVIAKERAIREPRVDARIVQAGYSRAAPVTTCYLRDTHSYQEQRG